VIFILNIKIEFDVVPRATRATRDHYARPESVVFGFRCGRALAPLVVCPALPRVARYARQPLPMSFFFFPPHTPKTIKMV